MMLIALFLAAAAQSDLPPPALVEGVLEAHPRAVAADARTQAARARGDALARGTHEVTLQGTASRRRATLEDRDFQEFDGTLSRAFRLPGKARLDRQAGALGIEVASNAAEDARHQLARQLATLWYDWLGAAALYRNAQTLVDTHRAEVQAVERRVSLRDASPLDLDQVRAAQAAAEIQLGEAMVARDRARAMLAASFPELPLPAEPPVPLDPAEPQEGYAALGRMAVERSHDIEGAEREAERQSALARRARLDRIADPTLGLRLFSERGGQEKGAGLYASIPFGGGHRRALADEAAAEMSAAQANSANIRREVEAEAAADVAGARARIAAWMAAQAAVASAESAAARSVRGHALGALDLSDRLYAQRQAHEARRAEIESRVAADAAILHLRIDAHTLWIE